MLGRLFKLAVLLVVAITIGRLLLKPRERLLIRSWVQTVAIVLLISSVLIVLLHWLKPELLL